MTTHQNLAAENSESWRGNPSNKRIHEEEKMMGWPSIWQKVKDICKEVGLPDANQGFLPKSEVKKAIFNHHMKEMKKEMKEKYKKLDDILDDDFSVEQPYMHDKSMSVGRTAFKIRCQMLPGIPGNFENKFKNTEEGLICKYCQENTLMDQAHCLVCKAWEKLRECLDLTNILDLVKFFQLMLAQMERKDDENTMDPKDLHSTTPDQSGSP